MSDLPMSQEDHPAHDVPEATEAHYGTELGASVSDAATGLRQAKEDKRYSNTKLGNQMINIMSARNALGNAQRSYKENYN